MKYIFILLLLSGCSSLQNKAFDNIHDGDSKDHLVDVLGNPKFFTPSTRTKGAEAYYYQKNNYLCGFTIKDNKVIHSYCIPDLHPDITAQSSGEIVARHYSNLEE